MKDIKQAITHMRLYLILLETLEEVSGSDGLGGIPEGHAYMAFMSLMNLDQFQNLLEAMTRVEAIKRKNHFITKGPKFNEKLNSFKGLLKSWDEKVKQTQEAMA